jgi:hypothetical protein
MVNIKIFQFLGNFSADELKSLKKFIKSGLYTGNRNYEEIINLYINQKEKLQRKTGTETIDYLSIKLKIKKSSLHNRLSELYKICETYLTLSQMNMNGFERGLILLDRFHKDQSYKLFDNLAAQLENTLQKGLYTHETFKQLFDLYTRITWRYFAANDYENYLDYFKIKNDYLIIYLLSETFKNYIEVHQQKGFKVYRGGLFEYIYDNMDYETIIKEFKNTDGKSYNVIMIFYLLYKSFKNPADKESFMKSLELHRIHIGNISKELNEYIYLVCNTFCINQTNSGRTEFYRILFDLINDKIRTGFINELKIDNIPINNFRDYIQIAIWLGEIEWVKKFVEDYWQILPERYREDERYIAYGLICLEEKKYEEAVKYFNNVKKTNYLHYIDSGTNKTRAYYRMEMHDEALDEIKKIRNYFSYRKDIPDIYIKNYNAHLKDIEHLIAYEFRKKDKQELEMYFRKRKQGIPKRWIREELKKIGIEAK